MGGNHLRYPLPYPVPGFFSTTLPEPYLKSKNPTRPSLLSSEDTRGPSVANKMIVIVRTRSQGASTALREWPRWRRGQRWPVLLAIRSVVDNQCSPNGGSDSKVWKYLRKGHRERARPKWCQCSVQFRATFVTIWHWPVWKLKTCCQKSKIT